MFTAPAADKVDESPTKNMDESPSEEARRLGLLLDLPLCRFSWCILPHSQITINIWQPQYTLMFSSPCRAMASSSGRPHDPYSKGVNTVVGTCQRR